jgi:1,4-dihydroxy-2-naphthoate polyprenyltransferase
MHPVRIWLTAARPKTLIAGISPVLMGTTLALSVGAFRPWVFFFTLLTAVGIQIGTNLANDYFDFLKGADTVERKGSLRVMQAGLASTFQMQCAIILTFALTFLMGCTLIYRGGSIIAILLILSLVLAFFYTAGPYSLAYLGLGEIFVLIFFGPLAVLGTYYLQTLAFSKEACLAGIAPGCISTAILIANNVRDIDEDRKAQKKTLVVRFGKTFGMIEYVSVLFMALIPMLFFCQSHPFSLLTFLILLPAFPLMRGMLNEKNHNPTVLNQIFAHTGKLLFLFTFLFCLGWML